MTQISKTMPYAETILTEMIENIEHKMCCHLYLSRKGEVTWLAVTEKIMDDDGIWIGAVMQVMRANTGWCSKNKVSSFCPYLCCRILIDFQKSFSETFSGKFVLTRLLKISPHFSFVAALSCEM